MPNTEFVITIDGPAGVGKSSTAKLLAKKLSAAFLDTGATYRAATFAAMQNNCKLDDVEAVGRIIDTAEFDFEITANGISVKLNGGDITNEIRTAEVTNNVKFIALQPELRSRLVKMQRDFAGRYKKIITEGRDQGTVVFPDADYKFFLTADAAKRLHRRADELAANGVNIDIEKLQNDLQTRDASDIERKTAPLVPASDAVIIDNTDLDLEQTVAKMIEVIK